MTLLQTIFKKRKVHTISNLKQNVIETWCDSLLSINLIGWKLPRRRLVVSAGLWLSSRIAHVSMKSFPWPFIRRRHNDVHRTLSIPGRLGNQDVVFTGLLSRISDHCLVFISFNSTHESRKNKPTKYIRRRVNNRETYESLLADLTGSHIMSELNPDPFSNHNDNYDKSPDHLTKL